MDSGGPATGQALKLYQSAPKIVTVTIPDPTGILVGATGDWWAGKTPPVQYGYQASVAGAAASAHKTGIAINSAAGVAQAIFIIEPGDYSALTPGPFNQHEFWVTPVGSESQPVTFGQLTIQGTVKGGAS